MVPIQIFRRGCHQSSNGDYRCFSDGELSSTARAYNPARYRAPVVIGHPASDGPALGYVKALSYREGFLEAVPGQLEPGFVAKVRAGRYRKVSAAFFSPAHPDNPTPGAYHLRHVGFLGAMPPAVKGLRNPAFCECGGCQELVFAEGLSEGPPLPHLTFQEQPPGWGMDRAGLRLHYLALAYQEVTPGVSYVEAVMAVGG